MIEVARLLQLAAVITPKLRPITQDSYYSAAFPGDLCHPRRPTRTDVHSSKFSILLQGAPDIINQPFICQVFQKTAPTLRKCYECPQRAPRLSIPSGYCYVQSNRLNSALCGDDHATGLFCTPPAPRARNVTRNLNCTFNSMGQFTLPPLYTGQLSFCPTYSLARAAPQNGRPCTPHTESGAPCMAP